MVTIFMVTLFYGNLAVFINKNILFSPSTLLEAIH